MGHAVEGVGEIQVYCMYLRYDLGPVIVSSYQGMISNVLNIAGDFNAHIGMVEPGDEEIIRRSGWGTRHREGQELVEMLRRNGLAVAGTFFQQKQSHKITYRSGRHKDRVRPTGGAATAAQEGEGLQSVGGREGEVGA